MIEIGSRQLRRARERCQATPAKLRPQHSAGNRLSRRSKLQDDSEIIIRPTSLNAVASCKRARRDYRIRKNLRPARGAVHPRMITLHRFVALQRVALVFAVAVKRLEEKRAAAAAA